MDNDHSENSGATAVNDTFADEAREVVAEEVRRVLREHEIQVTAVIQTAVAQAMTEILTPAASNAAQALWRDVRGAVGAA